MSIFHIVDSLDWERAKRKGYYEPESVGKEGFIHCSSCKQVVKVANQLYKGTENLLLIRIDESKVKSEIKWEDLYNLNENYPHIYGPLNIEAVTHTYEFSPGTDGTFQLPDNI